nr:Putative relaxase [uncultured bacterium]
MAAAPAQARTEIREHFWQSYRDTWPARKADKERDWAAQKESEAKRRAAIKAEYLQQRAAIKADPDKTPADRKAAYSLVSMWRAMESAKLFERIRHERQALNDKHPRPGRAGYRLYLVVLAHDCNSSALAELRRQTPPGKSKAEGNVFSAERERDPATPVILPSVSYRVDQRGNVTYYADGAKTLPILLDTGREVQVLDHELESVEVGLRLALQKFGRSLDVHGSDEFKAQVLAVVLRTGLRVDFKDSALAAELQRLKAPQFPVLETARKTEEEIEAEYAGEVYGIDPDQPEDEPPLPSDPAEIDTDIYEDDEPAPRGPRMG